MFLIIPVWHKTYHFPVKTVLLILLNVALFAVLWPMEKCGVGVVSQYELQETAEKLVYILSDEHSGLSEQDRMFVLSEKQIQPFPTQELIAFFKKIEKNKHKLLPKVRYRWDLVYPVFHGYEAAVQEQPDRTTPYKTYGFRVGNPWDKTLVTHQFLHAGFLHLLFNMIFLWVIGCVLEEKLEWILPVLYVVCGAAAALAQSFWGPEAQKNDFFVGASGAVSGLMGFALLCMPREKVKIFYLIVLAIMPRFGTFDSPLWFYLPLWLFEQVLMTLLTAKSAYVNVGYMAHVGGFVCGAFLGWAYGLLFQNESDSVESNCHF